ncbi:MAG TPA: hypothetical protein VH877_21640 [Polyangia bacterium]|nr:hypothetical protein [Polyangia bacterium]
MVPTQRRLHGPRHLVFGCALLGLIGLGGCAAYNAARQGDAALVRQDYDRAIAQYQEALRLRPGNERYRLKLDQARRWRATSWLAQAVAFQRQGNLTAALQRCNQLLADLPEHREARELRDQLEAQGNAAAAQLAAARTAIEQRQDPPAVAANLRALLPLAPTFPEVPALLERAENMAKSNDLTRAAKEHYDARRFDEARVALEQASALDPSNSEAAALLLKTRETHAALLVENAQRARAQGHHKDAVDAYRKAAELMAHQPERQRALSAEADTILRGLAERLRSRSEEALRQNLLGLAWAQARASMLLGPETVRGGVPDLEPLLRFTVALELSGDPSLLERVRGLLSQGLARYGGDGRVVLVEGGAQPGQAILRLRLDSPTFNTQQDQIQTRRQSYVQRIDVVPNREWHRLQTEVTRLNRQLQSLDAQLTTQRSRVTLLKSNVEQTKAEYERLRTAQRDDETRLQSLQARVDETQQQIKQLQHDLDAEAAAIRALDKTLATTPEGDARNQLLAERTMRQQRAQQLDQALDMARKEKARRSAAADELRARQASLQGQLQQAKEERRRRTSELDAQNELIAGLENQRGQQAAALDQLQRQWSATPSTVEKPVQAEFSYPEKYYLRVARARGQVQLLDARAGAALLSAPLEARFEAESFLREEYRVPGAPDLYIQAHPLDFPSDDALREQLASKLAEQLLERLDPPLRHHGDRFVQAAQTSTGDARLNELILVYQARSLLSDPRRASEAAAAIRDALGLILDGPEEQIDLSRLDGR